MENKRATRFAALLDEAAVDAAILVKPQSVLYLAGYSSVCSGVLAYRDAPPVFCTLWLDAPEAAAFCTVETVMSYLFPKDRLVPRLLRRARKDRPAIRRVGIEKDAMLVRDYEAVREVFPEAGLVHITPLIDRLRAVKDPDEIEKIRTSARITSQAMEAALKAIQPGVTEIDVAAEAEYVMRKLGSERPAFGTFVAAGERTLLAHPHASRRVIRAEDPVVVDLGATWEGYASDMCRTAFATEPTPEQRDYLYLVVGAQQTAAARLQPGATAGEVYQAAYDVFRARKLGSLLPKDIGYGVGLRQSEFLPIIEKDSPTVLQPNMVIALLQTTGYTRSVGGLRVEDTFLITPGGPERLTAPGQSG